MTKGIRFTLFWCLGLIIGFPIIYFADEMTVGQILSLIGWIGNFTCFYLMWKGEKSPVIFTIAIATFSVFVLSMIFP